MPERVNSRVKAKAVEEMNAAVDRLEANLETGVVRAGSSWSDAELIKESVEQYDREVITRANANPGIQRRECEHEPAMEVNTSLRVIGENFVLETILDELTAEFGDHEQGTQFTVNVCKHCRCLYVPA